MIKAWIGVNACTSIVPLAGHAPAKPIMSNVARVTKGNISNVLVSFSVSWSFSIHMSRSWVGFCMSGGHGCAIQPHLERLSVENGSQFTELCKRETRVHDFALPTVITP